MAQARRIFVASDFSKASRKAFTTAIAMAKTSGATLTIVHVIPPFLPMVPEHFINTQSWAQIDSDTREWSQRQLTKLVQRARKAGVRVVGLLLEGDPADSIARAARSKHADFLVIGTHGRTGLSKLIVGSVAGRLVATASCPVVSVRST